MVTMATASKNVGDYRSLIEFINTLQRIKKQVGESGGIDLPELVVAGSQSAGKSSVLEGLVGRTRAATIATRCPIVIQIVNTSDKQPDPDGGDGSSTHETYAQFEKEGDNRKYTDFEKVRQRIEDITASRLAACPGKALSEVPIILKITSPDLVTLTVVDLPGVAKYNKDCETDFELESRELVEKYISRKNSLILAICAANEDISNSEAARLARIHDPNGIRTIGVLTKIDIMDAGTDAVDLLTGKDKAAPFEMIGVKNRSQKDIFDSKPIEQALEDEDNFFASSPLYGGLADKLGTKYLRERLKERLLEHISKFLPEVQRQVTKQQLDCQQKLNDYGNDGIVNSDHVLNAINQFCKNYHTEIEGAQRGTEIHRHYGSVKIREIFLVRFKEELSKIDPTKDVSQETVKFSMENSGSFDTLFYLPESPFKVFARLQIEQMKEPSLECARGIYEEMLQIVENCLEDKKFFRYPNLNDALRDIMKVLLSERLEKATEYLEHYFRTLASIILTSDGSFRAEMDRLIRSGDAISSCAAWKASNGSDSGDSGIGATTAYSEDEADFSEASGDMGVGLDDNDSDYKFTYHIVKKLVRLYFEIVVKQVRDHVPASLGDTMILPYSSIDLNTKLVSKLHKPEIIDSLVKVPKEVEDEREKAMAWKRELDQAADTLQRFERRAKPLSI